MVLDFLKDTYPPEQQAHLVAKHCCHIVGIYPRSEKRLWRTLWTTFNWLLLGYGCYAELSFGIHYITIDPVTAMDALCPVATSIVAWGKMTCVWYYRDELLELMNHVRELTAKVQSPEKMKIKYRFYTAATRLAFISAFFGYATTVCYSMRSIITNIVQLINGDPVVHEQPFKMIFPDILLSTYIKPITLILTHWHGFITVTGFCTADSFFIELCFYFTVLLKALQIDLRELVILNESMNSSADDEMCAKLVKLVETHNEIIDMIAKFSRIMVTVTLGHFVSASIIIGASVIDMLLFPGLGAVLYFFFTSSMGMELFMYCLGGQIIIQNSEDVADVAYCTHWYSYGIRVQKMILLIIIRAQRSLVIKVPFFAPSLPALTSIVRFTGSLITLVKSFI